MNDGILTALLKFLFSEERRQLKIPPGQVEKVQEIFWEKNKVPLEPTEGEKNE